MGFAEILRVAIESIRSNLFRAVLTMLGVIIGVAAVITMLALGTGAQRAVEQQLQSLGANIVTVTTGLRFMMGVSRADQTLTVDDAHALEADARYVTAVVPELQRRQQLKLGNRNISVQVVGTSPSYPDVNGFKLAAGRMFTPSDDVARRRVVVLGGEVPTQLETTAEALVGRVIAIRSISFEVIGVFEKKGAIGFMNPDNQVWVPLSTMQYRVVGDDKLSSISVQVQPGAEVAQAMVEIERVLRRTHGLLPGRDNDFSIIDRKQFLAAQQQATQIFGFLLAGIASVSLVVGGIGIMNIMLVSVTERTREIGIRKALGAKRASILLQFLIEAIVLCVLGGVLGILLGTGVATLLARVAGWQTYVSWDAVALAFGFSAGVGLVFGLWPAQRAARLDPIEALRHE